MKVQVEEAHIEQVWEVLDDIRMADLSEWYAGTGKLFEYSVDITFAGNDQRRVALLDGVPLCFWGWNREGEVWMFATNRAVTKAIALHKALGGCLEEMPDTLTALADNRNTVHHKWLRWLGFKAVEEQFIAPLGLPFTLFTRSPQCALAQ